MTAFTSLTEEDLRTLEAILRNEADMAFKRRVPILLDYLELHQGERVLDCGCGMGFYLYAMRELRPLRLVGLDSDPERLAWAKREAVDAELVLGDAERLPFEDGSFDKVLMSEVLEHLADDRRGLAEVHRVLAPGGLLAISVPNARYPFWWDPINAVWTALGGRPIRSGPIAGIWSQHERLYERDEVVGRIREAGFEVDAVEETTHYAFPFIHFLVYGIGKPLVERDLLPPGLRRTADRFSGRENSGTLLNPFNAVRGLFGLVDRLNERPAASRARTSVNVLVKARKPAG